jgi:mono/diheme cytochrome c family protein
VNGPKRYFVLIAVLFAASTTLVSQGSPSSYFEQNCSSCHTIGGGASVGPDLKNVTQRAPRHWLVEFIRDPDAKIAAKDPYATKIVADAQGMAMTPFPEITEEFGEALLEYIDQQSGAAGATAAPAIAGDAGRGRELFLGRRRLSNGAAACIACHQASGLPLAGGMLGPDLSPVHKKLGGDRGLNSWLHSPATPMMSTVFRSAPLTTEEAADLTAFLRTSGENSSRLTQAPLRRVQTFGLAGSLLAFVIAGLVWRGRLATHGVRRQVLRNRGGQ